MLGGDFTEAFKNLFAQVWQSIISFLPGSPFHAFIANIGTIPYLAELNWFFPVTECIIVLEVWLAAIAIFYVYRALLSYIHLIS